MKNYKKIVTAANIIMITGLLAFLLTPVFIALWDFDTDLIGIIVFLFGLALNVIKKIRQKKLRGWKLLILYLIVAILFFPAFMLIASIIYFLINNKHLG